MAASRGQRLFAAIHAMDALYHRQILQRALGQYVSPRALSAITQANLQQDNLNGLLFHFEYHFDSSRFAESLQYIEDQRISAAHANSAPQAWAAFGRLTHGAQDFYAHSNYVALWLEQMPSSPTPSPAMGKSLPPLFAHVANGAQAGSGWGLPPLAAIDALDPMLLKHPRLMTWSVAWFYEFLSIIPGLRSLSRRLAPPNSHARMNLDYPAAGVLFPYAIEAAVQRTVAEYERTLALMGEENGEAKVRAFQDK